MQFVEVKKGKRVEAIDVSWWAKTENDLIKTEQELNRPHNGRAERLSNKVGEIKPRSTLELPLE